MRRLHPIGAAVLILGACSSTGETAAHDLTLEEALAGIPTYAGQHRAALPEEQLESVSRAIHRIRAEFQVTPDDPVLHAWAAHAFALLGEDQLHRYGDDPARILFDSALMGYARSIELDPAPPRTYLAMGALLHRRGQPIEAAEAMDGAIAASRTILADGSRTSEHADARFVLDRARLWHIELEMALLQFDEACRSIDAFHGGGEWSAVFGKLEARLRARDYAAAEQILIEASKNEGFENDPVVLTQLAWVAWMRSDHGAASSRILQALRHEPIPTLRPRIWRVLLGGTDDQPKARRDLLDFVEHGPVKFTEWEKRLGRYVAQESTDRETDLAFLAAAEAEHERLLPTSTETLMIVAEANVHVGMRTIERSMRSGVAMDELALAMDRFRAALETRPDRFRWEWEFARQQYGRVADLLNCTVRPAFRYGADGEFELLERGGLVDASWLEGGTVRQFANHSFRPIQDVRRMDGLGPGDLVQCVVHGMSGNQHVVRLVVEGVRP